MTISRKSIRKMARIDKLWMPKCPVAVLYIVVICITIEFTAGVLFEFKHMLLKREIPVPLFSEGYNP